VNQNSNKALRAVCGGNGCNPSKDWPFGQHLTGVITMNTLTKTLTAAALLTVTGLAGAADEISANVSLANDYIWRGVSQTDEKPAISGGFDYSHDFAPVSWYIGTWASNVDPAFFGGTHSPSTELDLYTGLSGEKDDFSYDAGWLRYFYPGGSVNNTTEWHIGGGWKWLGATYYYSNDWFGTDDSASRIEGTFDYDLPYDIALSASVANNYGDGIEDYFTDSYVDWKLGVSKTWLGVDWGLAYTDTNIDKKDCGASGICDTHYVLSMSKSF
jgi:uncharacterized protein (TIGR02001 family)